MQFIINIIFARMNDARIDDGRENLIVFLNILVKIDWIPRT